MKKTQIKAKSWVKLSNYSQLTVAIVLIVLGLLIYYLSYNVWISGFLFASSLGICVLCFLKRKGPFEIAIGSISAITLGLFILCCTIESVHDKIENAIKFLFLKDWDWIALIVAVISLIFAACTWSSQEHTQKNTMRITPDIQLNLLKDIFRHSYRNMMVLYALESRLRKRFNTHYPSEEHIQKLKLSDDALFPESFIGEPTHCALIQNFKLELRNRNIEIDVVTEHLKDQSLPEYVKERDVRMIKNGIEFILERTSRLISQIYKGDHRQEIVDYVYEKAATRQYDYEKYPKFAERIDEALDLMKKGEFKPYYTGENSKFIKALYSDNDSDNIAKFLRLLNANIYAIETGEGEICIIPFNKTDQPIVKSVFGNYMENITVR